MSFKNNFNLLRFPGLASTNQTLKWLHQKEALEEYTVVVCSSQTAGKGQVGNHWESEPHKNLTFSLLLKPVYIQIHEQFLISKAVSLAILEVLKAYGLDFSIKWPNDIYYKDKKIGGILIENSLTRDVISSCIVGIGINVNQTVFVSDAPNPISLKTITDNEFDLEKLLTQLLQSIEKYINILKSSNALMLDDMYLDELYRKEGFYPYKDENGAFNASITGINTYGHLELKTDKGEKRSYAFKEVEFVVRKSDN